MVWLDGVVAAGGPAWGGAHSGPAPTARGVGVGDWELTHKRHDTNRAKPMNIRWTGAQASDTSSGVHWQWLLCNSVFAYRFFPAGFPYSGFEGGIALQGIALQVRWVAGLLDSDVLVPPFRVMARRGKTEQASTRPTTSTHAVTVLQLRCPAAEPLGTRTPQTPATATASRRTTVSTINAHGVSLSEGSGLGKMGSGSGSGTTNGGGSSVSFARAISACFSAVPPLSG